MLPLLLLLMQPSAVTVEDISRLLSAGEVLAAAEGAAQLAADPATPIEDRRFAVSVASGGWRDEYKRTGAVVYLCKARGVLADYLAQPAPPQAQVLARRLSQIETQLRLQPGACNTPTPAPAPPPAPRSGQGLRVAGGLLLGSGALVAATGLGVGLARMLATGGEVDRLTRDARVDARPFSEAEKHQLAGLRGDFDAARITAVTTSIVGGAVILGGVVATALGARRGRRVPGVWANTRTWGITWTVQF